MSKYVAPTLTVDAVIFQIEDDRLKVLLIKRTNEPFKGEYALPGGYNQAGDTTKTAVADVVKRKTGVDLDKLQFMEQLMTFDTVARDPRGHAVSITYMGAGRNIKVKESDTTQDPGFFDVTKLPKLGFDHGDIIKLAHERLRSKMTYSNVAFAMLPKEFTLTQLQRVYELVYQHELDKRNFRKKFLALDLIKDTNKMTEGAAHRPAKLYTFKKQKLETLERSFD